jgi:predicted SnoaL-like aldol condensation-catalyzing enzyme
MSEAHKAAALAVFEVWSTGELDRLDALVAEHVVHHDPYDPNAADGLAGMKKTIAANRERFPDMQVRVEAQLADGDFVANRWTATMAGVTIGGMNIDRFEDGKIVEGWRSMDMLGLLRGLGALPDA